MLATDPGTRSPDYSLVHGIQPENSRLAGGLDSVFHGPAALLLMSLAIGGAGDAYVLLGASLQLAALALLAVLAWLPAALPAGRFVVFGKTLAVAALALPLLHLVPLPFDRWAALPGRGEALAILRAIGAPADWRPLSLDPADTLAAALELLPGIAIFWAATRLSSPRQHTLAALVLVAATVSACLGVFQRSAGLVPVFAAAHAPYGPGLFVNRNHQATMMLVAIVLAPAVIPAALRRQVPAVGWAMTGIAVALFAGAVIVTTSRAGLALLPLALLLGLAQLAAGHRRARGLMLAVVAIALLLVALGASGAGQLVADRFADGDERAAFWRAALPGIRHYWPLGSGIGTFDRVFPFFEPDSLISPFRITAAHNDYVQLLLEGGGAAGILMVFTGAMLVWAAFRTWRGGADAALGRAAAGALVIILLHTAVDFPLRMMALSTVFGLLVAILAIAADRQAGRPL